MMFKNIVKYILISAVLVTAMAAPGMCNPKYFRAQHWIIGTVESAAGGSPASDGRPVWLYFRSTPSTFEPGVVGPTGSLGITKRYMMNAYAIPNFSLTWEAGITLEAKVPIGGDAYGAGPISIETTGAGFDFAPPMTLSSIPVILTISPSRGAVGISVTLAGLRFGASRETSVLHFAAGSAETTFWSDTQIIFTVPLNATAGLKDVYLEISGNYSNKVTFEVTSTSPDPLVPSIRTIDPSSGEVGISVTLTGINFGITTGSLYFDGLTREVTFWSNTQIIFTVPSVGSLGTKEVYVKRGTRESNRVFFTVTSLIPDPSVPSIMEISPDVGPVGISVTLRGINFGSTQGSSDIYFAGINPAITDWSDTQIIFTVPSISLGTKEVYVDVAGRQSNTVLFNMITTPPTMPPSITSITPDSGPPLTTTVTLDGTYFGASHAGNNLYFGGRTIEVISWGLNKIEFTVSAAAAGTNEVFVETSGGRSNIVFFNVLSQNPRIYAVSFDGTFYNSYPTAKNIIAQRPLLNAMITMEAVGGYITTVEVWVDTNRITTESRASWLTQNPLPFSYQFVNKIPGGRRTVKIVAYSNFITVGERDLLVDVMGKGEPQVIGAPMFYPTPFSPVTRKETAYIAYNLSVPADVTLYIYDTAGNIVWTRKFGAGSPGGRLGYNAITWNGRTDFNRMIGNGMFVYKIIAGKKALATGKIVVLD